MNQDNHVDGLVKNIKAAFLNVKLPKHDNITNQRQYDDDVTDIEHALGHKDWRDLNFLIDDGSDRKAGSDLLLPKNTLFFLTPEGFQFYLPAFLIASLRPETSGVISGVVGSLYPSANTKSPTSFLSKRHSKLTPEQRKVVIDFIEHLIAVHPNELYGETSSNDLLNYWRNAVTS